MARKKARVGIEAGAEILGVKPRTLRDYWLRHYAPGARKPTFPAPDSQESWDPAELKAWKSSLPGRGMPAGAERTEQPCQRCGTAVRRRWRHPESKELVCKPCLLSDDPIHGEG